LNGASEINQGCKDTAINFSLILFKKLNGRVEVLMMKQLPNSAVPGVHVFPGGVIRQRDCSHPPTASSSFPLSAKLTALRETLEECGISTEHLLLDPHDSVELANEGSRANEAMDDVEDAFIRAHP
jgi:8-oxo-dGTP pyrophosphatase MutT (NUDIX family)